MPYSVTVATQPRRVDLCKGVEELLRPWTAPGYTSTSVVVAEHSALMTSELISIMSPIGSEQQILQILLGVRASNRTETVVITAFINRRYQQEGR
jgi:hypothetical protein